MLALKSGSNSYAHGLEALNARSCDTDEDNASEDGEEFVQESSEMKTSIIGSIKSERVRLTRSTAPVNEAQVDTSCTKKKKGSDRKMGGLSLPDVVRELLKERNILRWDPVDSLYEVLNGEKFEARQVVCSLFLLNLAV